MISGRIGCAIAALAVLSVLAIFFFPALQGPYPAVHGPVSALLSIRAAAGLHTAIVRAGLSVARTCLGCARAAATPLLSSWRSTIPRSEFRHDRLADGFNLILRC